MPCFGEHYFRTKAIALGWKSALRPFRSFRRRGSSRESRHKRQRPSSGSRATKGHLRRQSPPSALDPLQPGIAAHQPQRLVNVGAIVDTGRRIHQMDAGDIASPRFPAIRPAALPTDSTFERVRGASE